MGFLKAAGLLLAVLAVGFVLGRRTSPEKVVTRVETRVIEKIVTQTEKKADEVRVTTVRRRPDGTITKRTEVRDKSVTTSQETSASEASSLTHTIVERSQDAWAARGLVSLALHLKEVSYGIGIEHRILGPIWVGAWGTTAHVLGVSLGVSF